jgi:hypothetical protein
MQVLLDKYHRDTEKRGEKNGGTKKRRLYRSAKRYAALFLVDTVGRLRDPHFRQMCLQNLHVEEKLSSSGSFDSM